MGIFGGKDKKKKPPRTRWVQCAHPVQTKMWNDKTKRWVYSTGYCSLEKGHAGGHRV